MEPFLILGRPRSRTAWVANLLTAPPVSFCYHEGLADSRAKLSRLKERLNQLSVRFAGNADTGLIHHLDELLVTFPTAKLVVMTGNDRSWSQWCSLMGVPSPVQRRVNEDFERTCVILRGRAHFADCREITTNPRSAAALWAHCLPDVPFDLARWEFLRDLNVQVVPGSILRRLQTS